MKRDNVDYISYEKSNYAGYNLVKLGNYGYNLVKLGNYAGYDLVKLGNYAGYNLVKLGNYEYCWVSTMKSTNENL